MSHLLTFFLNEVMTAPLEISHIILHLLSLLIYFVFPHSISFLVFVYLCLVCLFCLFPTLECKLHKVKVSVFFRDTDGTEQCLAHVNSIGSILLKEQKLCQRVKDGEGLLVSPQNKPVN